MRNEALLEEARKIFKDNGVSTKGVTIYFPGIGDFELDDYAPKDKLLDLINEKCPTTWVEDWCTAVIDPEDVHKFILSEWENIKELVEK